MTRKTRRRKRTTIDKTSNDDDGTQIEMAEKKAARKPKAGSKNRTVEDATVEQNDKANDQLQEFSRHCLQMGVQGIVQEFVLLKQETAQPGTKVAFDANTDKNRYKDVFCVDASRVKLISDQDYIHANYMDFAGFERKYICTQGPTDKTIGDFWQMIIQCKIQATVMLCGILEQGKKKCEQYWPEQQGSSEKFGDFLVHNKSVTLIEPQLIQTTLEVHINESEHLIVTHYFWQGWPDRGVPKNPMACMRLISKLHRYNSVVVHCSAGIGRTGTIIGLDYCNRILQKGEQLRIKEVVKEMRKHRRNSVQTDVQYLFMHRVMINVAGNKRLISSTDIQSFINSYDAYIKAKGG